jgi:hypothetical protein
MNRFFTDLNAESSRARNAEPKNVHLSLVDSTWVEQAAPFWRRTDILGTRYDAGLYVVDEHDHETTPDHQPLGVESNGRTDHGSAVHGRS